MNEVYDPELQRLLAQRVRLIPRVAPRQRARRSGAKLIAVGAAAAMLLTPAGLASEVNAAAEAEGISCADPLLKLQTFTAMLTAPQGTASAIVAHRGADGRIVVEQVPSHHVPPAGAAVTYGSASDGHHVVTNTAAGGTSEGGEASLTTANANGVFSVSGDPVLVSHAALDPSLVEKIATAKIACGVVLKR